MDWQSEKKCFSSFINETAEFYCLKDKTGARWIQWCSLVTTNFCRWDSEQHTGVEVDWRDTVEQVGKGSFSVWPQYYHLQYVCMSSMVFHIPPPYSIFNKMLLIVEPGDLSRPQKPSFATALLPHRLFHTPGSILACLMQLYSRIFSCFVVTQNSEHALGGEPARSLQSVWEVLRLQWKMYSFQNSQSHIKPLNSCDTHKRLSLNIHGMLSIVNCELIHLGSL